MDWFRQAIDEAGGVKKVAAAAGMSASLLKSVYRGQRQITTETVNKLRPIVGVDDGVWFSALIARPHRKRAQVAA